MFNGVEDPQVSHGNRRWGVPFIRRRLGARAARARRRRGRLASAAMFWGMSASGRRALAVGVCLALAVAACSDANTPPASSTEQATGGDLLADVEVSRGPHSTISAVVEAETSNVAVVSVEVDAEEGSVESPPPTEAGTSHRVPVVGMRAETTYRLRLTAAGADGSEDSAEIEWTTGALPDDLPPLTVDVADAEAMAPGVTLFTATLGGGDAPSDAENTGYLLAVDGEGDIVWYYESGPSFMEVSQTAQGTLLVQLGQTTIREIDVLGNTVRSFATRVAADLGTDLGGRALTTPDSEPLAIESSHHELQQLDSGNIITLSTELVRLDDATARELCQDDPETDIISDTVVELSSAGEVVQEWPLTAVYDPVERPGTEMCVEPNAVAPPNWFYPDAEGLRDWTHGNAVVVDEEANHARVAPPPGCGRGAALPRRRRGTGGRGVVGARPRGHAGAGRRG